MENGGFFSIKKPWNSCTWEMPFMKSLLKLKGVRLVRCDACMTGSLHKKSTGFLTNAPWIVDWLCDMETRPHVHVPLEGKVMVHKGGADQVHKLAKHTEDLIWYTSLAAEYTEGMCNKLAKGFESHLKTQATRRPPTVGPPAEDQLDPSLQDLTEQFASVRVARPKLRAHVCPQLLTRNR